MNVLRRFAVTRVNISRRLAVTQHLRHFSENSGAHERQMKNWEKIFRKYAGDDKLMDKQECLQMMSKLEFEGSQQDVEQIFKDLDIDDSGSIDQDEFKRIMQALTNHVRRNNEAS